MITFCNLKQVYGKIGRPCYLHCNEKEWKQDMLGLHDAFADLHIPVIAHSAPFLCWKGQPWSSCEGTLPTKHISWNLQSCNNFQGHTLCHRDKRVIQYWNGPPGLTHPCRSRCPSKLVPFPQVKSQSHVISIVVPAHFISAPSSVWRSCTSGYF